MNEEEKRLNDENGEEPEVSKETELDAELEEIRDMLQTELDKANGAEGEESKEALESEEVSPLIQPLDEVDEGPTFENDVDFLEEDEICKCCGEKRRDTSFGDDYPYCTDCRNLMVENPFNPLALVLTIIIICIAGFSLGFAFSQTEDEAPVVDGVTSMMMGNSLDAVSHFETYFSQKSKTGSISKRAVSEEAKILARLGYFSDAKTLIDDNYSESELKMPWNKELASAKQSYDELMTFNKMWTTEFSDAISGSDDFNYKKDTEKLSKIIAENEKDEKYNPVYLYYGEFLLETLNKSSIGDRLLVLDKMQDCSNGENVWLYGPYYLDLYAADGDEENAKKWFDTLVEMNKQDIALYTSFANVYRFGATDGSDKMLEIAKEAATHASENVYPTYYKTYAVAYLLKGDGEKALNNMTQYAQSCQMSEGDFNIFALCAISAKDDETFKQVKQTLESYGLKLNAKVLKCHSGKLKIKDVLTEKGGEF